MVLGVSNNITATKSSPTLSGKSPDSLMQDLKLGVRTLSHSDTGEPQVIKAVPHMAEWCNVEWRDSAMPDGVRGANYHPLVVESGELVQAKIVFTSLPTDRPGGKFYYRAGPRGQIAFDPKKVKACIATSSQLCPGLNTVIRELVFCLHQNYGVEEVNGIQFGFQGFYAAHLKHKRLTPDDVSGIHHQGGTVLGTGFGGFEIEAIISSIVDHGYNHVYLVGGDGTHKAVLKLYEEAGAGQVRKRRLAIAVIGIPASIDNDIPFIDRSFGYNTCTEECIRAIRSAAVEAESYENGVSIVKLMGRQTGFISVSATLASRDVNICLIPEVRFRPELVAIHVERKLRELGRCVIVVAEGAGADLLLQAHNPESSVHSGGPSALLGDGGAVVADGHRPLPPRAAAQALPLHQDEGRHQVHRPDVHGADDPAECRRLGDVHRPRAQRGARGDARLLGALLSPHERQGSLHPRDGGCQRARAARRPGGALLGPSARHDGAARLRVRRLGPPAAPRSVPHPLRSLAAFLRTRHSFRAPSSHPNPTRLL